MHGYTNCLAQTYGQSFGGLTFSRSQQVRELLVEVILDERRRRAPVPLQSSPLAFCTHSSVLQISRAVCARFDHAPARWREQDVIEDMFVVSILVYFFCRCINRGNKSDVESCEKAITLQPDGENKM